MEKDKLIAVPNLTFPLFFFPRSTSSNQILPLLRPIVFFHALPRESFDFLSVSLGHSRETDKLVRMSEEQKRDKGKPMG